MPKRKSPTPDKKYTRPGVEAAVHLLSLPRSSTQWTKALDHYRAMLLKKGGETLVDLDKRRAELAKCESKKNRHITKDELLDIIIPWKFAKGKPRNALKPLLQSNSPKQVQECSTRAIEIASQAQNCTSQQKVEIIKNAINELCNLKGIGPASASAILSIFHPHLFAFMDDEVIEALYDGKRGYTLKIYEVINEKCGEICQELNELDKEKEWTRCEVGQVLWTVATMKANGEEGLEDIFEGESGSKKGRK